MQRTPTLNGVRQNNARTLSFQGHSTTSTSIIDNYKYSVLDKKTTHTTLSILRNFSYIYTFKAV